MQTSAKGLAFLERQEGVVLKAYRDVAGVWTIGAGLTAASGVVKPKAGMVITRADAESLLAEALRRNYEPAVEKAMARRGPRQAEFDAAVSFHFNTGAIARASWVKAWIAGAPNVRARLALWCKAGGRTVAGLVRRRKAEADLLLNGYYGVTAPVRPAPVSDGQAKIAAPVTAAEVPGLVAALVRLGHARDVEAGLTAAAVRSFQAAHGLTVDGIVGRATASGIQRALDARGAAVKAALPAVAAAPVSATDVGQTFADGITGLPWAPEAVLAGAAIYALWKAWAYRDAVAGAVDKSLPRVAAKLRSV